MDKFCTARQATDCNIIRRMRIAYRIAKATDTVFFSGEAPRSRRYGRTAALRLIVQPCDEGDNDDDYFLSFS
jgi:hypothetical protein